MNTVEPRMERMRVRRFSGAIEQEQDRLRALHRFHAIVRPSRQ